MSAVALEESIQVAISATAPVLVPTAEHKQSSDNAMTVTVLRSNVTVTGSAVEDGNSGEAPLVTAKRRPFQPIPPSLLKPGTEMIKVSAKSTRRVQTKKVWLELGSGFGSGDIRICWDKNSRGVGQYYSSQSLHSIADRQQGRNDTRRFRSRRFVIFAMETTSRRTEHLSTSPLWSSLAG